MKKSIFYSQSPTVFHYFEDVRFKIYVAFLSESNFSILYFKNLDQLTAIHHHHHHQLSKRNFYAPFSALFGFCSFSSIA